MARRRMYPRWLVRGLGLFALAMLILAAISSREHHRAESERNDALSRLVALEAQTLQANNRPLAMQLALVAYGMAHTEQARSTLLDLSAGELPTRLLGPAGPSALALGDDGHRLAIGYRSTNEVAVYSLRFAELTPLATVPGARRGTALETVALSPSGRLLAVGGSGGRVALWNLAAPAHPREVGDLYAGSRAVRAISFSPGGGALAAADADGTVQRWSLTGSGQAAAAAALVAPGRVPLDAVSYGAGGNLIAAGGARGTLVIWRGHGGTRPLAAAGDRAGAVSAVAFGSPGGREALAAGLTDGTTRLFSVATDGTPTAVAALRGRGRVSTLAFSRDGRYLAAGTGADAARIWSTADWAPVAALAQPGALTGIAFTDGDRRLVSSDAAGTTLLWQFPPAGSHRFSSAIRGLTYSTTEPRLAVSLGGRVDEWDVVDEWRPAPAGSWYAAPASASPPQAYWTKAATATTTTITRETTGTDTTIRTPTLTTVLVNPNAGVLALRRTRAVTPVLSWALSPNGQLFAASGRDGRVWLWNVAEPADPQLVAKLSPFTPWSSRPAHAASLLLTRVLFAANSQALFASGSDHSVRIWILTTPDKPLLAAASPLTGPSSAITALVLSPNGHTLAVGTADGDVWLWGVGNANKAGLVATLTAAHGRLTALAFSPSGNTVAAGGSDRRLTFWHFRPYQVVNRICALEGTPITKGEWARYVPDSAYKPPCAHWKPPAPVSTKHGS